MLMYYLYTALFRAFPPCPRVLIEFLEAPYSESPYQFVDVETLLSDFWKDVMEAVR